MKYLVLLEMKNYTLLGEKLKKPAVHVIADFSSTEHEPLVSLYQKQ